MNNNFIFLKGEFNNIYKTCEEMEINVSKKKNNEALRLGRIIAEKVSKYICDTESLSQFNRMDLYTRLEKMSEFNLLDYDILTKYHKIRRLGNKAAHDNDEKVTNDEAHRMNRLIFDITSKFYKDYTQNKNPNPIQTYETILYDEESEKNELYKDFLEKLKEDNLIINNKSEIKENTKSPTTIEEPITVKENTPDNDLLNSSNFKSIKNSYLIGELNKLKDSSQEAVEGFEELSNFKKYLHIERSIQEELISKLKEVSDKEGSKLIMLCGSVGDGKSHLLAYLNSTYPEIMKKFNIHNDATESFDPQKTSIDTLNSVLKSFNDKNIKNSNEKLILSINLGVLNNFMESDYAKNDFLELNNILNELNIFESNNIKDNYEKDPVSIISFSDYNLFEFNNNSKNRVESKYIKELINKITDPNDINPFYQAYLKDKSNQINSPIIYNYEMLSDNDVQNVIISIIIKVIIKHKKIISTRELLNFIYEIIVPAEIIEYDETYNVLDYINQLLPNLLFQSQERCDLLRYINMEDPIRNRSEITDKVLIDLNINSNIKKVLEKYMDCSKFEFLANELENIGNIQETKEIEKQTIIDTIMRLLNIFGNEDVKIVFTKNSYLQYLNYLYYYNVNDETGFKILFDQVKDAIFKWKGQIKKYVIYVDNLDTFKVGETLKLKFKSSIGVNEKNNIKNRFKTSIQLDFIVNKKNDNVISLNVDYQLYEIIMKLIKGYRPNKNEQKNLILFQEFIEQLIDIGTSNEYIVQNINENMNFTFEYDEFGYFNFEKEML